MIKIAQISRTHWEEIKGERVSWLDQFAESFEKQGVQSIKSEDISNKTVEAVVNDYREKIGLNDYLKRISSNKLAQDNQVKLFPNIDNELREKILNFIKNKIETHRGRVSVPAIQYDITSMFRNNGITETDATDPNVASFISNEIASQIDKNQTIDKSIDLGRGVGIVDVDQNENADALKGLMPATAEKKKRVRGHCNWCNTNTVKEDGHCGNCDNHESETQSSKEFMEIFREFLDFQTYNQFNHKNNEEYLESMKDEWAKQKEETRKRRIQKRKKEREDKKKEKMDQYVDPGIFTLLRRKRKEIEAQESLFDKVTKFASSKK